LIKGLGAISSAGAPDALWTGAPQMARSKAVRRLEIPEAMQKKYGYRPPAPDGPVETRSSATTMRGSTKSAPSRDA